MFVFRLESVRRLREAARDERRAELAEALLAESRLLDSDRALSAEQEQLRQDTRRASGPGDVQVDALIENNRHFWLLASQRRQLAQQCTAVQEEIERRRAVLAEADRELKVLEKLRDRQRSVYEQAILKRDQRLMDEVAGQRHHRLESRT